MNKKILGAIIAVIVIILLSIGVLYTIDMNRMKNNKEVLFSTWGKSYEPPIIHEEIGKNTNMNIVLSLEDTISENSVWCGTFNLIWNDLKNDIAKQDIVFTPQLQIVRNLNKGTFYKSQLSEDSYYKVYGFPSSQLKKEIEDQIKKKFNETSDILDDFEWDRTDANYYFLYAMLKKEFEFPKVFTELPDGVFRNYSNVKYFGIDKDTDDEVRKQVEVLYYNSKEDFAIKLLTKSNDEVIISKGLEKGTFKDEYDEIVNRANNYKGAKYIEEQETLKIPNIKFDLKEELKEIQNKTFTFSNGDVYEIEKAIQTIKFELDKKGGKIKSEAGMMVKDASAVIPEGEPRKFEVDNTFTIFLKEKGKDLPYFASNISNISNVQKDVQPIIGKNNSEEKYFYGKVVEAKQSYIIVEPNEEEEIRKSSDKIHISLGENNDAIYELGTNVKITYNGYVLETYPAQIEASKIEIKSAENFEIRFFDKRPITEERFNKIIDEEETEKYDYNIYTYEGNANILINGEEMSLRNALLENKITMNEIIAKANRDFPNAISYDDGGSREYHYDTYTIIKCHSLNGNRDVYIGTKDMTLNDLKYEE